MNVNPTAIGRQAETLASAYLKARGYDLVARNWRTRWCEIDIVARSATAIHIIEVKYRANTSYGWPAEYISADKRIRLARAAASWCQHTQYEGPYQIDVVEVRGDLSKPAINHLTAVELSA